MIIILQYKKVSNVHLPIVEYSIVIFPSVRNIIKVLRYIIIQGTNKIIYKVSSTVFTSSRNTDSKFYFCLCSKLSFIKITGSVICSFLVKIFRVILDKQLNHPGPLKKKDSLYFQWVILTYPTQYTFAEVCRIGRKRLTPYRAIQKCTVVRLSLQSELDFKKQSHLTGDIS